MGRDLVARGRARLPVGHPTGVDGEDEDLAAEALGDLGDELGLRDGGEIADEALRRVEHDLDLEEARLDR